MSGAGTYASSITAVSFPTFPSFAASTNNGYALNKRSTYDRWSVDAASECATPRFQLPGVPPREDVVVVTELVSLSDDADSVVAETGTRLRAAQTVGTPLVRRRATGVWDVDAVENDRMT